MKKRNMSWKKLLSAMAVAVSAAGIAGVSMMANAASQPDKTRGYINVSLDKAVMVHRSVDENDGGLEWDDDHKAYRLYCDNENSIFKRDNRGITYRTAGTYDMTDVERIGIYARTGAKKVNNIMMFYVSTSTNQYYSNKDDGDLHNVKDYPELVGNGDFIRCDDTFYMKSGLLDWKDGYRRRDVNITPRYGNEYVYIGLSVADNSHNYGDILIDNSKINGKDYGCVNLGLKAHNIILLESEQAERVVVDESGNSKVETYNAHGEERLALNDGEKYAAGQKGMIFRDEKVTFTYSLADSDSCYLKSFKFYKDAEKRTLLYEMNVEDKENQCTFTLDSDLIKTLEKDIGAGNLGDIYVEPVFEVKDITIDFTPNVVESAGNVEVTYAKEENGKKKYELREKDTKQVIGWFELNQAGKVGDVLTVDYTPNTAYTGSYRFRYYGYRMCESANQVNISEYSVAPYSSDKLDIELKTRGTTPYIWLSAHTSLLADVRLEDKTVTFNNKNVEIDPAVVTGVQGFEEPTGEITYHYYEDADCKNEMSELPINAGTYYVKAVMNQDSYYEDATSNVATLEIQKATPVLKNLQATSAITYGQNIGITSPTGTAVGVSGEKLGGGTFAWTDSTIKPATAGTASAEVRYTPTGLWERNYTEATGTAKITVNKATPTVTAEALTKTFDGAAVTSVPATVTGVNGENTGQQVHYTFYNENHREMNQKPCEAGTYYVSAYTSSNENYGFGESELVPITINKRECDLIPVPVKSEKNFYVYVTNVVKGFTPEGYITLTAQKGNTTIILGDEHGQLSIQEDESGRYYAVCSYNESIAEWLESASDYDVIANYVPVQTLTQHENYEIASNTLTISGTSEMNHQTLSMVYGESAKTLSILSNPLVANQGADFHIGEIKWLNLTQINQDDVVKAEVTNSDKDITFEVENAGTASAVVYVSGDNASGEKVSFYLFYDVEVTPAPVTVNLNSKSVVYSGNEVSIDPATVSFENPGHAVDSTASIPVSYTYYSGENQLEGGKDAKLPVNAGTYRVVATTEAQRNYQAGSAEVTLTITPAEPNISILSKTVTYDAKAHALDSAVVTGIDGAWTDTKETEGVDQNRFPKGSVSYQYDCDALNYHSTEEPVNAGEYTVTAIYTPGEADNYGQTGENRPTATLTIERARGKVEIDSMEMVYTGQQATPNKVYFTGVDGQKTEVDLSNTTDTYTFKYSTSNGAKYTEETPSEAGVYYVYVVRKEGGNYKRALSNRATLLIRPADITITLEDGTKTYSGDPVRRETLSSPAVVKNQNGEDITSSVTVNYQYYKDEAGTVRCAAPTDAGTYYVQAVVRDHPSYNNGTSTVKKLEITKAEPCLSGVGAEKITYGEMISQSTISGSAFGVKDENLSGVFVWNVDDQYEKKEAGGYDLPVLFIPSAEAAKNYTTAGCQTPLTVNPYTPKIQGVSQTKEYTGGAQKLDAMTVVGAEGMEKPTGTVEYTYYSDKARENPVPDSTEGVTDAGTYYCKAEFKSDTNNYKDTSSKDYQLQIKQAQGMIALNVTTLGQGVTSGTVQAKGVLVGVFDDPTGTVTIYQKRSNDKDAQYQPVKEGVQISKNQTGIYEFTTDIQVSTDDTYDFKAVYNEGTKKNYRITDGECKEVDMSKDSQDIYFEQIRIVKEYGADDFELRVVDEDNGTGEITFKVLQIIGDPNDISVSKDGKVKIKDTGRAFVLATKSGDQQYAVAYAIAVIQIVQAPVDIQLSDQTVTYSGKAAEVDDAVLTSHGKAIAEEENLKIVYEYEDIASGTALDNVPTDAGAYKRRAYSIQNEHYLPSTKIAESTLTIEKAKSEMELKAENVDKNSKELTLSGYLPGVFDLPGGTITVYKKISGQPDDQYEVAGKDIRIMGDEDNHYTFGLRIPIELNQTYDFKAVYQASEFSNYQITDGQLKDVSTKNDTDDPGKDDPGKDDPGKDDPGKDDPGKDDPGTIDPGKDNPGKDDSGKNNTKTDDGSKNGNGAGKNNGKETAANTGDESSVSQWLLILGASAIVIVMRKRERR